VVTVVSANLNGYRRVIVNRGTVVAYDWGGVNSMDNDRRRGVVRVMGVAHVAAGVAASTERVSVNRGKRQRSRDSDGRE
jgi:hypothetical protein